MTKRCLSVRLKEHATQVNNNATGKHFSDCEHAQYLANLQNQFFLVNDIPLPSGNVPSIENLVFNNFRMLHLTKYLQTTISLHSLKLYSLNTTIHNLTHD